MANVFFISIQACRRIFWDIWYDTPRSLKGKVSTEKKEFLVCITGYVSRKDSSSENGTFLYYKTFCGYKSTIDRGGVRRATKVYFMHYSRVVKTRLK